MLKSDLKKFKFDTIFEYIIIIYFFQIELNKKLIKINSTEFMWFNTR